VHVQDASRSVGVVEKLVNPETRSQFAADVKAEYAKLREHHRGNRAGRNLLDLAAARARRFQSDWPQVDIVRPSFLGVRAYDEVPLGTLAERIDWGPFFHAWEMKGAYPAILSDPIKGPEARRLFEDAQSMLAEIITHGKLTARAVIGLFAANASGDDLVLWQDDTRSEELTRLPMLRQQFDRGGNRPCYALSDFVSPVESGVADYMGLFAVTAGIGTDELVAHYEADHDDYSAIMAKALADRLAEALAEYMHEEVRKHLWGYAPDEDLTNEELIQEKYRGIRPAPGYPACPDHTSKRTIFEVMGVPEAIDLHLTESCAMVPTAAVSGFYFAHPEATYFSLGKIARDQLEDYAARKGMSVDEAARWLGPNLED
jgi:5-methyltetrahydrofolate--homocysteine methyltransferase